MEQSPERWGREPAQLFEERPEGLHARSTRDIPAEVHEFLREVGAVTDGGQDVIHLRALGARQLVFLEQLRIREDYIEQVAKVVRDAGGHTSHRFQPIEYLQLPLINAQILLGALAEQLLEESGDIVGDDSCEETLLVGPDAGAAHMFVADHPGSRPFRVDRGVEQGTDPQRREVGLEQVGGHRIRGDVVDRDRAAFGSTEE